MLADAAAYLYPDGVAAFGLIDRGVLDLYRAYLLREIGGVTLDVNRIADGQCPTQVYGRHADLAEVVVDHPYLALATAA